MSEWSPLCLLSPDTTASIGASQEGSLHLEQEGRLCGHFGRWRKGQTRERRWNIGEMWYWEMEPHMLEGQRISGNASWVEAADDHNGAEISMCHAHSELCNTIPWLMRIPWATTLLLWGINLLLLVCQFSFPSRLSSCQEDFLEFIVFFFASSAGLSASAPTQAFAPEQGWQHLSPHWLYWTKMVCSYPWMIHFHICSHGFPLLVLPCPTSLLTVGSLHLK